jgi:folylpolyglutamate synthase/dihydropteroate synthase
VRLDQHEATDAALVEALAAVEAARGDIPLTYFEQGTLAAMWYVSACRRRCDLINLKWIPT